ncbi:MAG: diacylglycerol kinase family protein [Flavobacteriaceae bacterium]|jgi:diacylglycerol kinase (ATP)|nr:diacylglycerol kinase family protein [Flavobacteriaceae bacterium]MCB0486161.1 diacylglycerol kinase family protein [Flavobacteriaceae bacterium]
MFSKKEEFFMGRVKSIQYALKGLWILLTTEHSIIIQFFIAVILTIIGFIVQLSAIEWMLQLLAIGLVMVAEALNTAVEKLTDYIHPEYDKKIGLIKDISAGGPAIAAIIAIIIGCIIYIPKFS